MPTIPYPNVPNAPGVPDVPRMSPGSPVLKITLLPNDVSAGTITQDTLWGIFSSFTGEALFTPFEGGTLSTYSFDYSRQTTIATFPVEEGSFATYDKVWNPANPVVTLAFSGSEIEKAGLLSNLEKACQNTSLWDVHTPEYSYEGYTIERYSYRRMATKGATMLLIDVSLKEVKPVAVSYANASSPNVPSPSSPSSASVTPAPQSPSATPPVSSGQVQTSTPSKSTYQKAKSWFNKILGISD